MSRKQFESKGPLKRYRPTTPSLRFRTIVNYSELSNDKPEKSLLEPLKKTGGRNNTGRVTLRFRGGGHKRRYRLIDFKRDKFGVPGRISSLQYDPNRTAFIALVVYKDGEKRYILAPVGLKVDDWVVSDENSEIKPGNNMKLKNIPTGTAIHNVELRPGTGGQLGRSAGSMIQLVAKEEMAFIRLPSGELRKVPLDCRATIGQVSNVYHLNITAGKAGATRWKGRRGHQRGMVMNPVDHPHGGGEGKSKSGKNPVSFSGVPTKGYKTRNKKKESNKYIVARRRK